MNERTNCSALMALFQCSVVVDDFSGDTALSQSVQTQLNGRMSSRSACGRKNSKSLWNVVLIKFSTIRAWSIAASTCRRLSTAHMQTASDTALPSYCVDIYYRFGETLIDGIGFLNFRMAWLRVFCVFVHRFWNRILFWIINSSDDKLVFFRNGEYSEIRFRVGCDVNAKHAHASVRNVYPKSAQQRWRNEMQIICWATGSDSIPRTKRNSYTSYATIINCSSQLPHAALTRFHTVFEQYIVSLANRCLPLRAHLHGIDQYQLTPSHNLPA